jgi:hypothetical protein
VFTTSLAHHTDNHCQMPVHVKLNLVYSILLQDSLDANNGMASKLTIMKGRVRLCRTKIGSIFLFLLGVACILCVFNWFSSSYMRQDSPVSEFEGGGRRLAGLPGGERLVGHRKCAPSYIKHLWDYNACNGLIV